MSKTPGFSRTNPITLDGDEESTVLTPTSSQPFSQPSNTFSQSQTSSQPSPKCKSNTKSQPTFVLSPEFGQTPSQTVPDNISTPPPTPSIPLTKSFTPTPCTRKGHRKLVETGKFRVWVPHTKHVEKVDEFLVDKVSEKRGCYVKMSPKQICDHKFDLQVEFTLHVGFESHLNPFMEWIGVKCLQKPKVSKPTTLSQTEQLKALGVAEINLHSTNIQKIQEVSASQFISKAMSDLDLLFLDTTKIGSMSHDELSKEMLKITSKCRPQDFFRQVLREMSPSDSFEGNSQKSKRPSDPDDESRKKKKKDDTRETDRGDQEEEDSQDTRVDTRPHRHEDVDEEEEEESEISSSESCGSSAEGDTDDDTGSEAKESQDESDDSSESE
jgi:hypothetical protein